jgi:hypothetical protein
MKKFIFAIALALTTLTLSAKEVVKNPITDMKLSEALGVYTISGPQGAMILGNLDNSINLLTSLETSFFQEHLNFINWENQKYEVGSDKEGLYIIKVGAGAVKIRQSDVNIFLAKLLLIKGDAAAQVAKEKAVKIWNDIKE